MYSDPRGDRGGGGGGRGGAGGYRVSGSARGPGGDQRADHHHHHHRPSFNIDNRGDRGGGGAPPMHRRTRGGLEMPDAITPTPLIQSSHGSVGEDVELLANFFPLNVKSPKKIFHYDIVNISKPGDLQGRAQRFIDRNTTAILTGLTQKLGQEYQIVAIHDEKKNIFSTSFLQSIRFEVDVVIDHKANLFSISLQMVEEIPLIKIQEFYRYNSIPEIPEITINIYNQIFRNALRQTYAVNQDSFFKPSQRWHSGKLPMLDLVPGFQASVRPTQFGLSLNLHLKTACLLTNRYNNLDQFLQGFLGSRFNLQTCFQGDRGKSQLYKASKFFKGFKFEGIHLESRKVEEIRRFVVRTPYQQTFERTDFETKETAHVLVSDYFLNQYNISVRHYPLVETVKGHHCPIELCRLLPDQFFTESKFDAHVQEEMISQSKKDPNDYFNQAVNFVNEIQRDHSPFLEQFSIELCTKPVKFTGRVLPKPTVSGHQGSYHRPGEVANLSWTIFSFDSTCTQQQLKSFACTFIDEGRRHGLDFQEPKHLVVIQPDDKRSYVKHLANVFANIERRIKPNFIFVIIPEDKIENLNSDQIYTMIKTFTDTIHPMICQCIKSSKLKHPPRGYFDTLMLSMNGMLGGINRTVTDLASYVPDLPFHLQETMVVGVDVNHPGRQEEMLFSVAAAVGSLDSLAYKYSTSLRAQQRERVEMIHQIDGMLTELIERYKRANGGRPPRHLIIFRDGVSEGQFDTVLGQELPIIRAATQGIRLSLFVVQKRHTTRIALATPTAIPGGGGGMKPRITYNVPNGTVVDTFIVEPTIEGHVLNSHFSKIGTSHPTKYIVLQDDHRLDTNQIEMLCYFSCHNYVATTDVISIPTPVKYADLAAYRAKQHITAGRLIEPIPGYLEKDQIMREINSRIQPKESIRDNVYFI